MADTAASLTRLADAAERADSALGDVLDWLCVGV